MSAADVSGITLLIDTGKNVPLAIFLNTTSSPDSVTTLRVPPVPT
jgi:hypothetical protein